MSLNTLIAVLLTALLAGASLSAAAAPTPFTPLTLQDQWGKPASLNADTRLLIVSRHKAGGEWVRGALTGLEIADPAARQWLYVADIAAMPALITRMFALPAMRAYAFPVALVRDEQLIAGWPAEAGKVTVFRLQQLQVQESRSFSDQASLQDWLRTQP